MSCLSSVKPSLSAASITLFIDSSLAAALRIVPRQEQNLVLRSHKQDMIEIFPHKPVAGEGAIIIMENEKRLQEIESPARVMPRMALLAGVAGSLAALALLAAVRDRQKSRRFADHGEERRNPMHFFLAGISQHRRKIDRSGKRPLFERRYSVYEAY
jgi:hypothetical protein